MRRIKFLVAGVVLGLLLGLWFGVNIGREQPLLSSPFDKPTVTQQLERAGQGIGEAVERSGRDLQERFSREQ